MSIAFIFLFLCAVPNIDLSVANEFIIPLERTVARIRAIAAIKALPFIKFSSLGDRLIPILREDDSLGIPKSPVK